jgi:hypothetical protein
MPFKLSAFLVTFMLFAPHAHAFIEGRGYAGLDIVDPASFNDYLSSQDVKQIYINPRYSLVGLIEPIPNLLVGAQYDSYSIKVNSSNNSSLGYAELKERRVSAKLVYYLHNERFRTGPAFLYGITNDLDLKGRNSAGTAFEYDSADSTSFSGGWELGWKLGMVVFGFELGYQYYKIDGVSGPGGNAPFEAIALSGFYQQLFFGLGF